MRSITWKLILFYFLVLVFSQKSFAQNENPIPFKHRVGQSAPEGNIYRIKGDFTIIGNTNLRLFYHNDSAYNSFSETLYVDIDNDQKTFNSSSATLVFSEENNADPDCSEIRYAGLYWSGRTVPGTDVTFDVTKNNLSGETVYFNNDEYGVKMNDPIPYTSLTLSIFEFSDENDKHEVIYSIQDPETGFYLVLNFDDEADKDYSVRYSMDGVSYLYTENTQITTQNDLSTVRFKPIQFEYKGFFISINKLIKKNSVGSLNDAMIFMNYDGSHTPILPHTVSFDKRKVKLKGPNANAYTEITADGNAILYPKNELADIYVGYSDITDYIKTHGIGEYTVADIALQEGFSDNVGFFGNWGIIVIYQNSKMNWRDITIFDGYSFVQSLDRNEHLGEIEISGFGTVNAGPVELKLGLMAGEGDQPTGGDFLEIMDQKGEWVRLKHPMNTIDNFFNSTIYTPVKNAANQPIPTPRFPNLKNNIGVDIVQWDIANPNNSIIGNNQTSTRFRFGTNQDLYAIYALAFSVLSYIPDVQVLNQPISIDGLPVDGATLTVEPGQEITYKAEIRNLGSEEVKDSKISIPLPYTTNYISAITVPDNYGKITFDPDLGLNGTLIWDIGDIPLKQNKEEIIATLFYTVKVTEDCTILANTNCEASVNIEGFVSGTGKVSENSFTNLPFVYELKEGTCEGEEINTPLEIPIVKRAEFAAANCSNFEGLIGLINASIPAFCMRDTPVDLIDLISPTIPDFKVYFYTQEIGGNPLSNYFVNTYNQGKEVIWVAQGIDGACTSPRVPITIEVNGKAPNPEVSNSIFCLNSSDVYFQIINNEGYTLNYYLDDSPDSNPLDSAPEIDPNTSNLYTVWVSQSKAGECESDRIKVVTRIYDCSHIADISLEITADVNPYSYEGELVNFTITVTNIGDIPVTNVVIPEFLMGNTWNIEELQPTESKSFTFQYLITDWDLHNGSVTASVSVNATSFLRNLYNYTYARIFGFPEYLKDYEITTINETCNQNSNDIGALIIKFKSEYAYGTIDIREDGKSVENFYFDPTNQLKVNLKAGNYQIFFSVGDDLEITDNKTYIIEKPSTIQFELQEVDVFTCDAYELSPISQGNISFEVFDPFGRRVQAHELKKYMLTHSGTYRILGIDPDGIKCPLEKSIKVEIQAISELSVEVGSFCQNDYLTTVQLLSADPSQQINWSALTNNDYIALSEFDDFSLIQLTEPGSYQVTTTNQEGCIVGRKTFEVNRTQNPEPALADFYTICPTKQGNQSITVSNQFGQHSWFIGDIVISQEATLYPKESGKYTLVTTDLTGCTFAKEFEVEIKCEPTIIYSNAILAGKDNHGLMIVTDNLIESVTVQVFNRWGELIYTCQDAQPQNGKQSSCFWDGTVNGKRAIAGNYSLMIEYTLKGEEKKKHKIFDMIMVIE
ncbi:gliding motility-associated C-terminal domain-containing protein [Belliella kenyensis]|uniref:Gliding motility-associated C-terminal domain-containing protein n=1 Tax=Belliella kenyensis TaxID=1472724 RepID=A0ABV8EFS2_9BACT|nr:gliding motility-associated C-terminal domain-containing protein [Belliella kenyensis]MCH7401800.1 gliding motility-associated C-terminal domain-containing protein [Belliella kenyensis]MDN3604299.1 gliding motility-associated C-terminal domain-containing protein [Belliella kenyensis]